MYGLAGAAATVTMIVGFLSNLQRRGDKSNKLGRALRAYLARRRKKLVRFVEKVIHAPALKVLEFKYVPYDPVSGRVINKDGKASDAFAA